jgi:hypothetical protein
MKNLQYLDLFGCPVADMKDYREKVFEMLPQVKYLDGTDKSLSLSLSLLLSLPFSLSLSVSDDFVN